MTALAKKMLCIQMRSGVEIWVDEERADKLQDILSQIAGSKFVRFESQTFNTADIVGVFGAETMADLSRQKRGEWKCQDAGVWHKKNEDCSCKKEWLQDLQLQWRENVRKCGKCEEGYILSDKNTKTVCECVAYLSEEREEIYRDGLATYYARLDEPSEHGGATV